MAAHAAVPAARSGPAVHLSRSVVAIPVVLGIVYGFYAAFIHRSGGAITGGDVVLGLVSGLAVMLLGLALLRIQSALPRELRAAAYATLFGGAMGFLYSLTGASVLRSAGMGLMLGGGMLVAAFYVFYTHED